MSENTFSNIKPFYASPYGHSRLFTAIFNGKKVILKTLKEQYVNDAQCREDLKKEYELTSQLDHELIRKTLGFEEVQNIGECIVLEYVDGKSLAEHVRVGTLNEKQIKSVLIDICNALNYMHLCGIFHCDLKPENVMVTAGDYRVKIIDIGLPERDYKTDHELLIKENEFIAPELFKGEEADQRSDVYSVGKIIEFIIERNMLNQYASVATHCTQFSREQRFDSIREVKSLITKRTSTLKLILIAVAVIIVAVAAIIFVPKIIEKTKAEKAERLAVELSHEIEKINGETAALCEKYQLTSLNEPISLPAAWKEDSVRFSQQLARFMSIDELRQEADQTLNNLRQTLIMNRQNAHDVLLKQANDTTDKAPTTILN